MHRQRILILGQTKDNTYEIRNLLDQRRFELEIALSPDTGRTILATRRMSVIVLHTEALDDRITEFLDFLDDSAIDVPIVLMGEEASAMRERFFQPEAAVYAFEKPYPVEELVSFISGLACRA